MQRRWGVGNELVEEPVSQRSTGYGPGLQGVRLVDQSGVRDRRDIRFDGSDLPHGGALMTGDPLSIALTLFDDDAIGHDASLLSQGT